MISILTNQGVQRANRHLGLTQQAIQKSLERLSTGKRINRASDDPAGLIAATNLEGQETSLVKKIESLERRQLDFSARDGGLTVISEQLTELNGLVVTAANSAGLSDNERSAMQLQVDSILRSIDQSSFKYLFNGNAVLSNIRTTDLGGVDLPAGGGSSSRASLFDLRDGGALNLSTGDLEAAQRSVKTAIAGLSTERGTIGAVQKSMDSEINAARVELENVLAAKGQILDTDYAQETSNLVREQVKEQATMAVRQLAEQTRADAVLRLLQPIKPAGDPRA